MTDIVDKLKSSHSLLGDPLHREAWEEIKNLRSDVEFMMFLLGLTDNDPAKPDDTDGHPEGAS